ncbi:MAG: Crp/Fnr family transcriptional regulator, partial [Candidatus Dormibacteraceae bacterium]
SRMKRHLLGLLPGWAAASPSHGGTGHEKPKRDYLLTIDIFRDLQPADLVELDRQTEILTSPRGRILYSQDDHAEALFLLKRGRVQLYRLTPAGKRLELATLEPGTFFGEMPLLGESLRHAYAEAASDCLLCVMSRADVERLIRGHPQVALRMMEVLGRRLALAEARLEEMAYRSVAGRIAAVLLRLNQERGDRLVAITHQELGDMIGALRETVTKTLDEFQAAGLVEFGRGRISVRDLNGLRAYLED